MVPAEVRLMMQEKINVGGIIIRVKKQYNIVWNQFEPCWCELVEVRGC